MEINHEIHYISFKFVPKEFKSCHPSVYFYVLDLPFPRIDIVSVSSIIKAYFFLRRILKTVKPDIIFGGWIQRDGLISAMTNYHPFILITWGGDILLNPFRNIILRKGSSWVIRKADKIVCDAKYSKKRVLDLVYRNPDDVVVFPRGIELQIFKPGINRKSIRKKLGWEKSLILIMTRNFNPIYNVSTFLKVLPTLCLKFPELRIIMCGMGIYESLFKEFIKEKELSDKVYLPGFVPRTELPSYYEAADIYVSSSLSDGSSNSLLESMAMKLPVVVSKIPTNMEWVKHDYNGLLFPAKDKIALIKCLSELITNESQRSIFAERNKQIALERANWDRNYEKLEETFQKVVNDNK
jgi:glycosyltransferase involved in cell wall biosynthesis